MTPERIAELRRLDAEHFIVFYEKGEPSPLSDEWNEMLDEIERLRAERPELAWETDGRDLLSIGVDEQERYDAELHAELERLRGIVARVEDRLQGMRGTLAAGYAITASDAIASVLDALRGEEL